MTPHLAAPSLLVVVVFLTNGCRDKEGSRADSASSLPPVFPSGPVANAGWNPNAGPVMIVSAGGNTDTVAVILPEASDSTIESLERVTPPVSGLTFDLFGRAGKIASGVAASPLTVTDSGGECASWPLARLQRQHANWQIGFVSGRVQPIALDSIESLPAVDSAALAVSLAQTSATLPVASDPTFRGLPFRVRSAYRFRLDTVDIVIADVVRTVNEEANPRVEHLLIIGERPRGASGKFDVGYYNRTAGAEESTQATEILTAIRIGVERRPAIVISIEYDEGGKLGLIERTAPGEWRATWTSAYTDC